MEINASGVADMEALQHIKKNASTMKIFLLLFLNVCLAQAQTKYIEIETTVDSDYEAISGSLAGPGCSLACAMGWTLSSTSNLISNGNRSNIAKHMSDGLPNTAWIEGVKGYGNGERIMAKVEGDSTTKNISFWGIRIANGYQKDSKTWKNNSRVKKIKVYHNSKPILIINLQDKMGVQSAKWNSNVISLNNGDLISFEIIDVYKGDKYEDTAISDLVLDGAH